MVAEKKEPEEKVAKDSPVAFSDDQVKAFLKGIVGKNLEVIPKLEINCGSAKLLPLGAMAYFQEDFKSLTESNLAKMVRQILKLGFLEPVSVWEDSGGSYILNGHQRVFALRWMEKEMLIDCSEGIPVNIVKAKDAHDASMKCLALASTYGRTDKKGLAKFCKKGKVTQEQIELFHFADLEAEKLALKATKKKVEFEATEGGEDRELKEGELKCPVCSHIGPEEDFEG